jgi:anti-anti-sigma regulatory factor
MSGNASNPPQTSEIAYEVAERAGAHAVVVDLLIESIGDPGAAARLGQQLSALIRPDLPKRFVLDFHKVKLVGSTGFGALVAFVLKVREAGGRVAICSMDHFVRFGADVIHLGNYAEFTPDRSTAIDVALKD